MFRLVKGRGQPDAMRSDVKDVGTQFMIVSGVGGGWGRGSCPKDFSRLVTLDPVAEMHTGTKEHRVGRVTCEQYFIFSLPKHVWFLLATCATSFEVGEWLCILL